ncbi:WRB/Get1 family [Fomitopsis serialis]|uniref:WRB/Get1 family n=1 Tax=Fomitopsis serialis TaxID=139415 RepID=UPI002008050F|nr:WRB/Get1 family [Neoantrodia serialis]KAH9935729.1 WRB/Get1 family [Neoantrodia serialis]
MSLIITLFALVFVTELISWIGKSVLLEFAYAIYLRIFHSSAVARQRKLKSEILVAKKELLQTSAQDQFAKWAKLRRGVDKGLADLEKLNSELSSARSSFSLKFSTVVWVLTAGLQFFVGWWYRKSAVFYLPPGWFGPLTWWLSFPFAPAGSVSCGVGERVVKELAAGTGTESVPVPSERKEKAE